MVGFETKLQDMGFVEYVENLDENLKAEILNSAVENFIPWSAVHNENSLSTPCRMVFDASMGALKFECSLSSMVAKGFNSLSVLVQILIRWGVYSFAFPRVCDVILHDTCMDDCISGETSLDLMLSFADEMTTSVAKIGFTFKGFTCSG